MNHGQRAEFEKMRQENPDCFALAFFFVGVPCPPAGSQSAALQPVHPLPGILNLGQAGVGVLPEFEEFAVVLAGSAL
jgi:hypothetical protein